MHFNLTLQVLKERNFPYRSIKLLASARCGFNCRPGWHAGQIRRPYCKQLLPFSS